MSVPQAQQLVLLLEHSLWTLNVLYTAFCPLPDIEQLIAWTGNALLPLLEEQLDPALYTSLAAAAAAAAADGSSSSVAAEQQQHLKARLVGLLYATANLCSVNEVHREAVVASKIPALLLQHLSASSSSSSSSAAPAAWLQEVRLAAVWCVINMLWSEAGTTAAAAGSDAAAAGEAAASSAAAAGRVAALKHLGYEDALKNILTQCTGLTGATAAAEDRLSPSAPAGAALAGAGSSWGAGVAAAAAAGLSVPLPPPLPADVYSQDLCERLQTALEQLGVK
jgi:hypothetical protein